MKYYGTKNNKDYGFYKDEFENSMPIEDEYWVKLLLEQSEGKIIIPYDNKVIAVYENEYSNENGIWKKLTSEEISEKKQKKRNEIRKAEILTELENLDQKRIRAIAEPCMKDENITWLEFYNQQSKSLRTELSQLS